MSEKFNPFNEIKLVNSDIYKNIKVNEELLYDNIVIDDSKSLISQYITKQIEDSTDLPKTKIEKIIKHYEVLIENPTNYDYYNDNTICKYTDAHCDYCDINDSLNINTDSDDFKGIDTSKMDNYKSISKKKCDDWNNQKKLLNNNLLIVPSSANDPNYNIECINYCSVNYKRLVILFQDSYKDDDIMTNDYIIKIFAMIIAGMLDLSYYTKDSNWIASLLYQIVEIEAELQSQNKTINNYIIPKLTGDILKNETKKYNNKQKEMGNENEINLTISIINERIKENINFLNSKEESLKDIINKKLPNILSQDVIDKIKKIPHNGGYKNIDNILNDNILNDNNIFVNKKMQEYFNENYFKDQHGGQIDNYDIYTKFYNIINIDDPTLTLNNHCQRIMKWVDENEVDIISKTYFEKWKLVESIFKNIETFTKNTTKQEKTEMKLNSLKILDPIIKNYIEEEYTEIDLNILIQLINLYNLTLYECALDIHEIGVILNLNKEIISNNAIIKENKIKYNKVDKKIKILVILTNFDLKKSSYTDNKIEINKKKINIKKKLQILGEIKAIIFTLQNVRPDLIGMLDETDKEKTKTEINEFTFMNDYPHYNRLLSDLLKRRSGGASPKIPDIPDLAALTKTTSVKEEFTGKLTRTLSDKLGIGTSDGTESSDGKNIFKWAIEGVAKNPTLTTVKLQFAKTVSNVAGSILGWAEQKIAAIGTRMLSINPYILVMAGIILLAMYLNRDWIFYILGLWRFSTFKIVLEFFDSKCDLTYYKSFASSILDDWTDNTYSIYNFFSFFIFGSRPTYLNINYNKGTSEEVGDSDYVKLLLSIIHADQIYNGIYTLTQLDNIYTSIYSNDIFSDGMFYTLTNKLANVNDYYNYRFPAKNNDKFQELLNKIIYNTAFAEEDSRYDDLKKYLSYDNTTTQNRNVDFTNIRNKFLYTEMMVKLDTSIGGYERKTISLILLNLMKNPANILKLKIS